MTDSGTRHVSSSVPRAARILLVDDEPMVLRTWKRLLAFERRQWQVHTAESGAAALELLAECTYDVVVSDLMMPEMSGLELLRIVRDRYPETVRVVCSARLDALDDELAQHLLHVVVEKSEPEGLVDALSQALRYSQAALREADEALSS